MTTNRVKKYRRVQIDQLIPFSESIVTMSPRKYKALLECIQEIGQLHPLICRNVKTSYEVIDGNQRYNAMKEIGVQKVDIVDLGIVPDDEAYEIHLSLNINRGKTNPVSFANALEKATNGDAKREIRLWKNLPLVGGNITNVISKIRSKVGPKTQVPHNPKAQPSFVDFRMRVPPDAAKICDKALDHIETNCGVKRPRAFELMAADYLAGAGVQGP